MEKKVVLFLVLIAIVLIWMVDSSLFNNIIMDDTEIPELLKRKRIETVRHLAFFAIFLIVIYIGSILLVSSKEGDDI